MLADLVEVQQRVLQALDDCGHATEAGTLQLLALEERLAILEQADVVAGDGLDEVLCRRELTEGNLEVVGIVEGVEEILVERVDVLESGKAVEDGGELFRKGLLGELDLSGVEGWREELATASKQSSGFVPDIPRIRLILKPERIWVGNLRCVRLRTMSRNSC
jgi:hypothetical protein